MFSKLGIGLKNIFASFTAAKKIKDDVDWNASSFDVGFAMANLSICNNTSHRFLLKSVKGSRVDHFYIKINLTKYTAACKLKIGLEWLPRFLKEPRRLWERNLKSTPIFLWWIIKEKIKQIRENISDTEAEG